MFGSFSGGPSGQNNKQPAGGAMALISMYERDNSRTVYRILADEAVKCFQDPSRGAKEKIPLTNLARLLERYRYDVFSDHVPMGILEAMSPRNSSFRRRTRTVTRHMEGVIGALQTAHQKVYGNVSAEELVPKLQETLAKLASAAQFETEDDKRTLDQARRFFVAFSEGLR